MIRDKSTLALMAEVAGVSLKTASRVCGESLMFEKKRDAELNMR